LNNILWAIIPKEKISDFSMNSLPFTAVTSYGEA
jgi:hypothetical protein